MNWLEFISSIITTLIWPTTIIILIILFRTQLGDLVPLIKKLKYKDFELEFEKTLTKAKKDAGKLGDMPKSAESIFDEVDITNLAQISPRSVVIEAWLLVEQATMDIIYKQSADAPKALNSHLKIMNKLRQDKRIDSEVIHLLNELRMLRNSAAHSQDFAISPDLAIEYAQTAKMLVNYLNSISQ